MAIARAGDLPIVALAAHGHRKRNNLPIVALPAHARNLPVVALVVRGHHKRGSLPVIALTVHGHLERGDCLYSCTPRQLLA